ncbi:hypothetical protein A6X21_20560 [Planctopirus hydrillae]|uniref:Major facilitator superfamily (MFS) profile domain-containing protein n=2 Tax=Planctopirus hydrillae TaxID=1841610 RepID=A0A1C3EHL9_9PLAN|nr:hypothetical protein A6X21_20560 [Planctopirus hydrillae]
MRTSRSPWQEFFWGLWTVVAAFGCYFSMYAFRKPFTAGSFNEPLLAQMDFKSVLVISQVFGYMLSKFIGIKVIAETPPHRRVLGILILIALAQLSLIGFGLTPRPWNLVFMFFNGLPLGMVFGLVLGCLEGRRSSEALTAGLCASFILAGGVMKSVGTWLLRDRGISEDWMPAAAGGLFTIPLGICLVMLALVPPPSIEDIAARTERSTMSGQDRWAFFSRYAPGLLPIIVFYLLVTILRSLRDDFQPEIWKTLGSTFTSSTFTKSETLVTLGVIAVNGTAVLIRNNRLAFFTALGTCGVGLGLLAGSLIGHHLDLMNDFTFIVLLGLGLYLPYVAFHTTVFERLIAMTRDKGTVGFLMYVVDAIGYLGFVGIVLLKNYISRSTNVVELLIISSWASVVISTIALVISWVYFSKVQPRQSKLTELEVRISS